MRPLSSIVPLLVALCVCVVISAVPMGVSGQAGHFTIAPFGDGTRYKHLANGWWRWFVAHANSPDPSSSDTHALYPPGFLVANEHKVDCLAGLEHPQYADDPVSVPDKNVLHLPALMQTQFAGPAVSRTCRDNIPVGTDFFFPLFNYERDRPPVNKSQLVPGGYACLGDAKNSMLELIIDGQAVTELLQYYVVAADDASDAVTIDATAFVSHSPKQYTYPSGFNYPVTEKLLWLISGGYHALVQGLAVGKHVIQLKFSPRNSQLCGLPKLSSPAIDITYTFNIV